MADRCGVHCFFLDFSGENRDGAVPGEKPGAKRNARHDAAPYAEMPFFLGGERLSGVSGFVSARSAGSMRYAPGEENPARREFFRLLGAADTPVFSCVQVHSRRVLAVDRETPPAAAPEADGMITDDPGLALAVTVADCLPVFLYDTVTGARALLHSGWKGTGIALAALAMMAEKYRSRAENIAALFGPCIQLRNYAVDEARARAFSAEFGQGDGVLPENSGGLFPLGSPVEYLPDGRPAISLQAANAHILAAAGVRHFSVCRNCTFEDARLGSYRREGPSACTRMAAVFPALSRA